MSGKVDQEPEDMLLDALFGAGFSENKAQENNAPNKEAESVEDAAYLDEWRALCECNGDTLKISLYAHLDILADTAECEQLLKDILAQTQKAEIIDNCLSIFIDTTSGNTAKLVCSAPKLEDGESLSDLYSGIYARHAGFSFPDIGRAAFDTELGTSAAVFLNGPSVSTMFDPETPEEENMLIVIDTHQDWFVASTETMIAQNKPLVSFLSHSSFKETVLSDEYSAGGHYLRLIARTILGEDDSRVAKLCHI